MSILAMRNGVHADQRGGVASGRGMWTAFSRVIGATLVLMMLPVAIDRAEAQTETVSLTDWVAGPGARFTGREGGVVAGTRGNVRSRVHFVDFVLRLEYRLADARSEAAVLVRAWFHRWDQDPATGYRVYLASSSTGATTRAGTVKSFRDGSRQIAGDDPVASSQLNEWQRLEIQAQGHRLTIRHNEAVINVVEGSEPLAGGIVLEVIRGGVEFRSITVEHAPLSCAAGGLARTRDAVKADTPGLVMPRLLKEQKPRYTYQAMLDKAAGTVSTEAIVDTDGSVAGACISKGLHQQLDAEAIGAARHWKFVPGQLNGSPVAVVVTIDLTFTLR